nr:S9 family peptidase [Desulfobacterales bacterium]
MKNISGSVKPRILSGWEVFESEGLKLRLFTARLDKKGPLPLVLVNHGGGGMDDIYEHMSVHLASLGYAVACLNFRGYYGSEGKQEYGKGEIRDVLNLVDFLKARDYVDINRIGMFGYSRGGLHALLAAERSDDFKVLVIWSAPVDVAELSRLHPFIMDLVGGSPEELPDEYYMRSPINFVEDINSRLLIIHGELDIVVPTHQALRLTERLKELGKDFEFKILPGEGHTMGPEGFNLAWKETVAFLNRFLRP